MRRHKLFYLTLMLCALFLTACGRQDASTASATPIVWTQTDQWPDNAFTQQVPEPRDGQVYATTQGASSGYDFFAVQLTGLTREEVKDYFQSLADAGYLSCAQDAGMDLTESGVTVGDLFYRQDGVYYSVSATDQVSENSMVLYIAHTMEQ